MCKIRESAVIRCNDDDTMRNAVEEAVGTIVNVELLVENKEIVNEKILSRTKGYIQKYKVNSEEEKAACTNNDRRIDTEI